MASNMSRTIRTFSAPDGSAGAPSSRSARTRPCYEGAMVTTATGIDGIKALAGQELGRSDWVVVDQARIDRFADATDDHQWIHTDPERAASGPFGGTIAHGYLTLSLAPALLDRIVRFEGISMLVNYGIDKLRFPAPLPVGGRVRLTATLSDVVEVSGGLQLSLAMAFEVEGQDRPACVADVVYRVVA
jgi:acyl dehydratase